MSERFIEVVMAGDVTALVEYNEATHDRLRAAVHNCDSVEFENVDGMTYTLAPGVIALLIEYTTEQYEKQIVRRAHASKHAQKLENQAGPSWD